MMQVTCGLAWTEMSMTMTDMMKTVKKTWSATILILT